MRILIPALVTFIPGSLLTTAWANTDKVPVVASGRTASESCSDARRSHKAAATRHEPPE